MGNVVDEFGVVRFPDGEIRLEILDFVIDIFKHELQSDWYIWTPPSLGNNFRRTMNREVRTAVKLYLSLSPKDFSSAECLNSGNPRRLPHIIDVVYNEGVRYAFQSGVSYCEKVMYIINYASQMACFFRYAPSGEKYVNRIALSLAKTLTLEEPELMRNGGWDALRDKCNSNAIRLQYLFIDFRYHTSHVAFYKDVLNCETSKK